MVSRNWPTVNTRLLPSWQQSLIVFMFPIHQGSPERVSWRNWVVRQPGVMRIASQAGLIGGDVVYAVVVELNEQPSGLCWGMSVEVEIATD